MYMYFFKKDKLVALTDISQATLDELDILHRVAMLNGRVVDISKHGRAVCSGCHIDLGERPGIPAGEISHGICKSCKNHVLDEIQERR